MNTPREKREGAKSAKKADEEKISPTFSHACDPTQPLARRLGVTVHVSPLRMRILRLMERHPSPGAERIEDWLFDVANARGARSVTRGDGAPTEFQPPVRDDLSDEDLIAAICQPHNLDRPQILRAAGELITRGVVDPAALSATVCRERADRVLAELARQALRVEPDHAIWSAIAESLRDARPLRSPLLHWSRLAFPLPDSRGVCGKKWMLVA